MRRLFVSVNAVALLGFMMGCSTVSRMTGLGGGGEMMASESVISDGTVIVNGPTTTGAPAAAMNAPMPKGAPIVVPGSVMPGTSAAQSPALSNDAPTITNSSPTITNEPPSQ